MGRSGDAGMNGKMLQRSSGWQWDSAQEMGQWGELDTAPRCWSLVMLRKKSKGEAHLATRNDLLLKC